MSEVLHFYTIFAWKQAKHKIEKSLVRNMTYVNVKERK